MREHTVDMPKGAVDMSSGFAPQAMLKLINMKDELNREGKEAVIEELEKMHLHPEYTCTHYVIGLKYKIALLVKGMVEEEEVVEF